jgi:hypothetical protein
MARVTNGKIKGEQLGMAVNQQVVKGAQHIGTIALTTKDFVISFAVSAFGLSKPKAAPKRVAKKAVRRTK